MMRALAVALLATLACQGPSKLDDKVSPPTADGGIKLTNPHGVPQAEVPVPPTNWTACDAALKAVPKTPPMRRAQHIVNACKPCGEWKPLLDWSTEAKDGGPKRHEIEQAMLACKAYCNPNAKARFLGTLDAMRGKGTRGPWRFIGELCKGEVSALPDNRYISAPLFALDRIARAAAARPESAQLLEAIELPMPAISVSGFGYDLAHSPMTAPEVGPIALTVTPNEMRIASIATGKLGKDGVTVTFKGETYPGALVKTAKDLGDETAKIVEPGPDNAGPSISIFSPRAMPAIRLLDALAVIGERPVKPASEKAPFVIRGQVRLAVTVDGGLPGWATAGSIPIALRSVPGPESVKIELGEDADAAVAELKKQKPALMAILKKLEKLEKDAPTGVPGPSPQVLYPALVVVLAPAAKVEGLAKLLGAAGYFDIKSVALIAGKAK
jgi:hypothetical protein